MQGDGYDLRTLPQSAIINDIDDVIGHELNGVQRSEKESFCDKLMERLNEYNFGYEP